VVFLWRVPLPLLWWLVTIFNHMSWFLTLITNDFLLPLWWGASLVCMRLVSGSSWCKVFCTRQSCSGPPWGRVHRDVISVSWCGTLPLLGRFWSCGSEVVDSILQMYVSFLHFKCLVVPLFVGCGSLCVYMKSYISQGSPLANLLTTNG
jgi:hypothetical protein